MSTLLHGLSLVLTLRADFQVPRIDTSLHVAKVQAEALDPAMLLRRGLIAPEHFQRYTMRKESLGAAINVQVDSTIPGRLVSGPDPAVRR
jgi:hypothetical protein